MQIIIIIIIPDSGSGFVWVYTGYQCGTRWDWLSDYVWPDCCNWISIDGLVLFSILGSDLRSSRDASFFIASVSFGLGFDVGITFVDGLLGRFVIIVFLGLCLVWIFVSSLFGWGGSDAYSLAIFFGYVDGNRCFCRTLDLHHNSLGCDLKLSSISVNHNSYNPHRGSLDSVY